MANKDSKRKRCDSSSSDDCVFVSESALSSDDELNINLSASKSDISTSSLSNDIIDTSFTAKPLLSRNFTLNKANKIKAKYIKNQILDICTSFARGKKNINFTITTIAKNKSKNILKPLQTKKIESKNKQTFHNQSSSSSKTKSEIINYKDASNSKDCELVTKNNLTEDNSKNETNKYLRNTELNINLGTVSATNNFTRQSISSNKNESKNEYRKDTALNGDLNADIKNNFVDINDQKNIRRTADKNVVQDDLNDHGWFSKTFEEVVDSENTFDNCVEMWESYYELNKSDAFCSLELSDKTIDNTLTNITADYFPTCLGSLPGLDTSTNDGVKSKDIDTNFLEDIPIQDYVILDDNAMPCVTFNTEVTKKKKPIDDFVNKIFHLRIEDILKSELIKKYPDIFLFQDVKYKFVRITGTVSYLKHLSASKIFMKINDGTEEIFCCFQDFPDRLSNRISINNHLNKQSDRKLFSKKQLIAMGKKNDLMKIEQFLQKNTPGDNPFLNSITKIMLEKKLKKQPPTNEDIHLGDLLTIVGKVIELNEKLIYVRRIRKEDKTRLKNQRELDYSQISEYHEHYSKTDAVNGKEFIYCYI